MGHTKNPNVCYQWMDFKFTLKKRNKGCQIGQTKPKKLYQIAHVKRLLDGFVALLPKGHVVAPSVAGSVEVVPEEVLPFIFRTYLMWIKNKEGYICISVSTIYYLTFLQDNPI